jgi:D-arabinose 1-dehydrogenase-like Zn-dependent alcohol dehydrogenase
MSTMPALRLHRVRTPDLPELLQLDEVDRPRPAPGQVLVEVRACGVCASDLHIVDGVTPHGATLPQILGHEAAGTIAEVGDEVTDWQPGDRVAILMSHPCHVCGICLAGRHNLCPSRNIPGIDGNGAMAGFTLADANSLVPIPVGVPFDQAAITTDAVATPYHALKRAGVGEGVTLVIMGLGGLGMHAILLAKLAGATVIGVDLDPVNLERALDWGADEVVDASDGQPARRVRALTDGGADRALEFVGSPTTVDQAIKSVAPGGRATIVGLTNERLQTVPISLFVSQETELVGSFGSTPQDLGELFDLLDQGRLDLSRSITARIGLGEVPDALAALETREGHPIRTVVTELS